MRKIEMNNEQYAALGRLLDYLRQDEAKDYNDRGQPNGHIFEDVRRVASAMPDNRPDLPAMPDTLTKFGNGGAVPPRVRAQVSILITADGSELEDDARMLNLETGEAGYYFGYERQPNGSTELIFTSEPSCGEPQPDSAEIFRVPLNKVGALWPEPSDEAIAVAQSTRQQFYEDPPWMR